jgi:hypothetical protein
MDYLHFFQVFTPFHNVQANLDGHFVLERVGLALLSQKGQEVALVHVLEYDELRIVFGLVADSIEVNQVRVVDRVQRDRFFQEVQAFHGCRFLFELFYCNFDYTNVFFEIFPFKNFSKSSFPY